MGRHCIVILMRGWVAAVLCVACGGGDSTFGDAAPSGEPPELAGITAAHNQVRAGVGVGPLEWDDDVAAVARAWAARCVDEEAPAGLVDHNEGRGPLGENIYGSTAATDGPAAVASWASEGAAYDHESNTCSALTCGHYTQVVWAATTKVGCALQDCPALRFRSTVVCDYAPAGNDGGRPY
jgi:pathogenesis-related protein 1